jgi:chemotaxis protein methyltransferase CheR
MAAHGKDAAHVAFLQAVLPRLGLRWEGFRRVRGQVEKRIDRRVAALGLDGLDAYRAWLEQHEDEWPVLDALCRVTISRFARDRAVWDHIVGVLLVEAARSGRAEVRAWSAGCGAGEEPYTLAIAWMMTQPQPSGGPVLRVLATDANEHQLARAAAAVYPRGTLRELPEAWRDAAFELAEDTATLRAPFREPVRFVWEDLRSEVSEVAEGPFDLVLCRNVAFTYFEESVQRRVAARVHDVLRPGGALVVGLHEGLPEGVAGFEASARSVYRRS